MSVPPPVIEELVDRFERDSTAYVSDQYNEAQLRREFLDPLFAALGWDVSNASGYAEGYKDVIHEDAIKIGSATKAPDYAFRIGGVRKFFLEAKRPSSRIKDDPSAAFQLRRYAWSANLPISVLSNFRELAIYDCRVKPDPADPASTARIFYWQSSQYVDKWPRIAEWLSKEAILKGALDRFTANRSRLRGTAAVDEAFLAEIESWRRSLAENLALRNADLSQRELNFCVMRIIDRIVFLRICEDRGIESHGQLLSLVNGPGIYARMLEVFTRADEKYNSGLFHFTVEKSRPEAPDILTPELKIDDATLRPILQSIYYPKSPYEFSVLPADILGRIYEQFLGKVIRLTAGHRAKVEEKPEVRKAGGVYYTPTHVVEFIVENTLGDFLESKSAERVAALRFLDPACGSGSFLLGAYQYLLDWHLSHYRAADPERLARGRRPPIRRTALNGDGMYRLTLAERKRILLNNIYGVDIDANAVETTKLSLLLKALEGESQESVSNQMKLFRQRALPDLGLNIKCGNSLIGSDYYNGHQFILGDDTAAMAINAFDWRAEFPGVMKAGGFDAVVGNPPYLFLTEVPPEQRRYFEKKFRGVDYRFDLYGAFIELAIGHLLRPGGKMGYIIPHTLLSNTSFARLRAIIAEQGALRLVVDIGPGVFKSAKNETMIIVLSRGNVAEAPVRVVRTTAAKFPEPVAAFTTTHAEIADSAGSPWAIHGDPGDAEFAKKMLRHSNTLGACCTVNQGLRTGNNALYLRAEPRGPEWQPAIRGIDVARYGPLAAQLYVCYDKKLLDAPRSRELFTTPAKIVVQEIRNISLSRRIVATLDTKQHFCLQSTNVIKTRGDCRLDIRFLLGLLNSDPVNRLFRFLSPGNNHIPSNKLASIPIPPASDAQQEAMIRLVDEMLGLKAKFPSFSADRDVYSRRLATLEMEINGLVCELYGFTAAEIASIKADAPR